MDDTPPPARPRPVIESIAPVSEEALRMELLRFFQTYPQEYYARLTQKSPQGRQDTKADLARRLTAQLMQPGRLILGIARRPLNERELAMQDPAHARGYLWSRPDAPPGREGSPPVAISDAGGG